MVGSPHQTPSATGSHMLSRSNALLWCSTDPPRHGVHLADIDQITDGMLEWSIHGASVIGALDQRGDAGRAPGVPRRVGVVMGSPGRSTGPQGRDMRNQTRRPFRTCRAFAIELPLDQPFADTPGRVDLDPYWLRSPRFSGYLLPSPVSRLPSARRLAARPSRRPAVSRATPSELAR